MLPKDIRRLKREISEDDSCSSPPREKMTKLSTPDNILLDGSTFHGVQRNIKNETLSPSIKDCSWGEESSSSEEESQYLEYSAPKEEPPSSEEESSPEEEDSSPEKEDPSPEEEDPSPEKEDPSPEKEDSSPGAYLPATPPHQNGITHELQCSEIFENSSAKTVTTDEKNSFKTLINLKTLNGVRTFEVKLSDLEETLDALQKMFPESSNFTSNDLTPVSNPLCTQTSSAEEQCIDNFLQAARNRSDCAPRNLQMKDDVFSVETLKEILENVRSLEMHRPKKHSAVCDSDQIAKKSKKELGSDATY